MGTVSHVDLPINELLGALVTGMDAEVVDAVGTKVADYLGRSAFKPDASCLDGQSGEFKKLHGPAYESLCAFMRRLEKRANLHARMVRIIPCISRKPTSTFVDWKASMEQVPDHSGGWLWVLKKHAAEYTSFRNRTALTV